MLKKKMLTITQEQVDEVARITGAPELVVRYSMVRQAQEMGCGVKFVAVHDPGQPGYFIADPYPKPTDRHESRCMLCDVPVYHHDRPPPNTVTVCMPCGAQIMDQEAGADEEGEAGS